MSEEAIFHDPPQSIAGKIRNTFGLNRHDDFTHNPQEIADSIKSETSSLTPEQQSVLDDTALGVKSRIEDELGRFFTAEKIKENDTLEKRITVVTRDQFNHVFSTLRPDLPFSPENVAALNIHAISDPNGIIIVRPKGINGWKIMDKKMKSDIKESSNGDLIEATAEANMRFYINILFHEIIHAYQTENNPHAFREAAAYYYANQLYDGYKTSDDFISTRSEWIKGYQKLVDKYGDDVHKLCFGNKVSNGLRRKILEDFNKMPQEIGRTLPGVI